MMSYASETFADRGAAHADLSDDNARGWDSGWDRGWGWGEDSHGPSPASVVAGYQFTISNGQVVAETILRGAESVALPPSPDASFAVGSGTVTETITGKMGTEVIQFSLEPGSSDVYTVAEKSFTFANPTASLPDGGTKVYNFAVVGGGVTAETVTLTDGAISHTATIAPPVDALFTIGNGNVTESWVDGNRVKAVTFVASSDGSGYVVSETSTTFIARGGSATALDVEPGTRAQFTIDAGGTVTAAAAVEPGGTVRPVSANSHVSFTQLAPGFVEESISWGNHSRYVVFHDGAGQGTYTEVAHGSGTSVDLVGLQAQLAQLPAQLAALV